MSRVAVYENSNRIRRSKRSRGAGVAHAFNDHQGHASQECVISYQELTWIDHELSLALMSSSTTLCYSTTSRQFRDCPTRRYRSERRVSSSMVKVVGTRTLYGPRALRFADADPSSRSHNLLELTGSLSKRFPWSTTLPSFHKSGPRPSMRPTSWGSAKKPARQDGQRGRRNGGGSPWVPCHLARPRPRWTT